MSIRNDKISPILGPAILAAAALLAIAAAVTLISTLVRIAPNVGDMIAFDPAGGVRVQRDVRLLVTRPTQFACVLDLDTISRHGGSLILEARLPGDSRSFFLHWAGERTSSDAADCGTTADLIVDRQDMDILALAAGGYGIEAKRPSAANSIPF